MKSGERKTDRKKQADEATRLLADQTRYRIFRHVLDGGQQGVTTAVVADMFGIHRNVARMHLEKLAGAGLLKWTLEKNGGGGRPARVYHIGDAVTSQYPPRDYRFLAEVLLTAGSEKGKPQTVARRMGRELGAKALAESGMDPGKSSRAELLDVLADLLERLGMCARIESKGDGTIEVTSFNCVFRELSATYADIVCGIHSQVLLGICESFLGKVRIKGRYDMAKGGLSCSYTIKTPS